MQGTANYYKIYFFSSGNYDCLVVCLSYESIYTYIEDLQHDICAKGITSGKVLIDQLLIAGNGENRFLSINFESGHFKLSTASNVNVSQEYKQITSAELKKKPYILKNSVLSSRQVSMIISGCVL